ncbi:hypothetical protein ACIHFD_49410 [Nonomuraea sp. NPDC051941]|uniref:hypothetical protein n=1 Tax=Nonomuraea sp. NPDC051941 TaxID=3364373 RepID=UPI0037CC395F
MTSTVKLRAHAATIDIVALSPTPADGRREGPATIAVPTQVYVDGQPLYVPQGTVIGMDIDGLRESAVEVTMTFFVRRLRVGYVDELDGQAGELPVPAGAAAADDEKPASDEEAVSDGDVASAETAGRNDARDLLATQKTLT